MSSEATISFTASAFLKQTDVADPENLFRLFARYLLDAANYRTLPVSLELIRQCCGLRRLAQPLDQRGFLFGDSIFVNSDDQGSVQRFTEAHEVMESLNIALKQETPSRLSHNNRQNYILKKEQWCEKGAADLLMPPRHFYPLVTEMGVSLATARSLSILCKTSLTATIRQMLSADTGACFFVIFKEGHKKSEHVPSKVGQGVLWGSPEDWDPPAELRVWRRWASPQTDAFLCENESVKRNTIIYQTFYEAYSSKIQQGQDTLEMEKFRGTFQTESISLKIGGEPVVMSLIHL